MSLDPQQMHTIRETVGRIGTKRKEAAAKLLAERGAAAPVATSAAPQPTAVEHNPAPAARRAPDSPQAKKYRGLLALADTLQEEGKITPQQMQTLQELRAPDEASLPGIIASTHNIVAKLTEFCPTEIARIAPFKRAEIILS